MDIVSCVSEYVERDVSIECDCGHAFTKKKLRDGQTVKCPKCKKTATLTYVSEISLE